MKHQSKASAQAKKHQGKPRHGHEGGMQKGGIPTVNRKANRKLTFGSKTNY